MSKEKIKIELKEWHYQCGDKCCDEWHTDLYLNGEQIEKDGRSISGEDVKDSLKYVLIKLGYEVEIIETYND